MSEESENPAIRALQNQIRQLKEEKRILEFKVSSTKAKNERLEKELERLRQGTEETNWNESWKDTENE